MAGLSDNEKMRADPQPDDSDELNAFAPKSETRTTGQFFRRTAGYVRPYIGIALADIILASLSLAFYFIFPQVTQYIIDDIIGRNRLNLLLPVIASLAGAYVLCNLFKALSIMCNTRFEQNVVFNVRNAVYAGLQRLPLGFFDARASGDLMTRVTDDIVALNRALIDVSEQGTTAIVSIAVVIIILLTKNHVLALYAFVPLIVLVIGSLWYTFFGHRLYGSQRQAIGAMNALLGDNLQGIRQIKAYGHEDHEDTRFANTADMLRRSTFGVMKVWAVYSPVMAFTGSLGIVLVLFAGGPMVLSGTMTLGGLISFLFYLSLLYEPIGRLHILNQLLQSGRAAGDRIFDILDSVNENRQHNGKSAFQGRVRGDIRFESVSFSYDGGRETLKNISLHARPGQTIALVGATGSGKTTLVNLLPAFYEPRSGRIMIDGQDIRDISLTSLRSRIGIVSQETFLFNGTVRENILYGKPDATVEEMEAACRAANCHDFITRLSHGYDMRVGERGIKLSVGEKQRVSIARTLLKDPPLLILDEATASVDTATEKLIQDALQRLMAHRTSFVIAHRLSTIRNADQIIVMADGEIVERGTHSELMDLTGVYAKLNLIQDVECIEGSVG
ncbi:MAG: transporter ATP-binding protein [Deltaproteobacteria bacterium]|nr:transporter ATP-binding protein [Deltaproteobacteria bacterium]